MKDSNHLPGPNPGYKQSPSHAKNKGKAQTGENNGQFKDGRKTYRKIVKAKPGDVVHHKDGNRTNNKRSNLQVLSDKPKSPSTKLVGRRTTAAHEAKERRASRKSK